LKHVHDTVFRSHGLFQTNSREVEATSSLRLAHRTQSFQTNSREVEATLFDDTEVKDLAFQTNSREVEAMFLTTGQLPPRGFRRTLVRLKRPDDLVVRWEALVSDELS